MQAIRANVSLCRRREDLYSRVVGPQGAVAAAQERGVLKVTVNNANNGGLLSAIDGLPAFLPFSLVSKRVGTTFITLEVCLSTPF